MKLERQRHCTVLDCHHTPASPPAPHRKVQEEGNCSHSRELQLLLPLHLPAAPPTHTLEISLASLAGRHPPGDLPPGDSRIAVALHHGRCLPDVHWLLLQWLRVQLASALAGRGALRLPTASSRFLFHSAAVSLSARTAHPMLFFCSEKQY